MKLIDQLMTGVCETMGWEDSRDSKTLSALIRGRLTPRCEAVDAVVEAAREAVPHLVAAGERDSYTDPDIGLSNAESRLKRALAALDEVRDAD